MQEKWSAGKLDYNPKESSYKYMKDLAKEQANYYDKWLNENASKYGYVYERGEI